MIETQLLLWYYNHLAIIVQWVIFKWKSMISSLIQIVTTIFGRDISTHDRLWSDLSELVLPYNKQLVKYTKSVSVVCGMWYDWLCQTNDLFQIRTVPPNRTWLEYFHPSLVNQYHARWGCWHWEVQSSHSIILPCTSIDTIWWIDWLSMICASTMSKICKWSDPACSSLITD